MACSAVMRRYEVSVVGWLLMRWRPSVRLTVSVASSRRGGYAAWGCRVGFSSFVSRAL